MFLSEWREFPSTPCLCRKKKNLMTARVSMLLKSHASMTCFRACFLPGRAKDLSAPWYFSFKAILVIILTHILLQDIKNIFETDVLILRKSCYVSFLCFIRSILVWRWPCKSRNCCNKNYYLVVLIYMIIKGKTFLPVRRSPTGCVWSRNLNNEVVQAPAGLLRHKNKKNPCAYFSTTQ